MNGIEIRLARIDDLPALAALQWQWRVEEWCQGPKLDREAFSAAFVKWVELRRDSHIAFVALKERQAVGMAWIATVERTPTPSAMTRKYGHLQSVYVVPEERDRGVGSALLERVKEEAQRLGLDYLLVHPSARSVSFYRRGGFNETDEFLVLRLSPR